MADNLKFELDRAFCNRRMAAALSVGCAISLWHLWEYVLPLRGYVLSGDYPLSSFGKWIGGENYSLQATVYFMWLPILCALPTGEASPTTVPAAMGIRWQSGRDGSHTCGRSIWQSS